MSEFQSWRSYWNFVTSTMFHSRYIRDSSTEHFLHTVLATGTSRMGKIEKGSCLWRAQLGCIESRNEDDQPCPFPYERMKPLLSMSIEGRANPKGIPYLYLATDKETAMAEVRPWLGSMISVGQFETTRDMKVINCSADQEYAIYLKEPSPQKRESAVWSHINRAFSVPVSSTEQTAEYIPTQVIAELFKNNVYDGIIYRSALSAGLNVVLFNLDTADQVDCYLYTVEKITFGFKETGNPYVLRKYHKIHDDA